MNTNSTDLNGQITAEISSILFPNEKQSQETFADSVNALNTRLLHESSQQEQSKEIYKQSIDSNHIHRSAAMSSLNNVLNELNKRCNFHFNQPLPFETFETEIPIVRSSSLDNEVQRDEEHQTNDHQNTDQEHKITTLIDSENTFQIKESSELIDSINQTNKTFEVERVETFSTSTSNSNTKIVHNVFQVMKTAGDAYDMLFIEDLIDSVSPLLRALVIREKYMLRSFQSYPSTVINFLTRILEEDDLSRRTSLNVKRHSNEVLEPYSVPAIKFENPFSSKLPPPIDVHVKAERGIYHAYTLNEEKQWIPADYKSVKRDEFIDDYIILLKLIIDGPLQSFCHRRLQYLKTKHDLHSLLSEVKEWGEVQSTPYRDFYNVRKVDTHIHAASSMHQKCLLSFIKKKMEVSSNMKVCKKKDGTTMTLKEVFDELRININDINVDLLGVHADRNTFQRFDRFNSKYNPLGQIMLREIFMKTDNYIDGIFFADLLKEVIADLEVNKYQHAEPRLSIYGKSIDEWDKLAKWFITNKMYSTNVAWMIQVPRIYDVYHANGIIKNFQAFLNNLFQPLFDATINPESHPDLFQFMSHFTGFDSVDDESKPEKLTMTHDMAYPDEWNINENPPYSYYLFYMYANILTLNQLRKTRGLNTYQFRPHCGEAGAVSHLVTAFMVAENISHGLVLREVF
ncbi:unnamed protein product [Rotaria sordida]|uniref:AMP deaminase n=2 Tax=Rotaria sordida TaxID=392033 RepID=A0A819MLG4_9BILA|nr:unnamed protein product [Rotaria sordida]CAF1506408.1 unnamed protein product [Rotaria sordida]CAF3981296.1 unnamed protein product [Rotaria sordida]